MDALRYSKRLRQALAWGWFLQGRTSTDACRSAIGLSKSLTLADEGPLQRMVLRAIQRLPGFDDRAPWEKAVREEPRYSRLLREAPELTRSLILKAPAANGEKGVLLMTFEYNWVRLLLGLDESGRRWMDDHYDLVLSTSWSPTDYAVLGLALASLKSNLFVQSCNYDEIDRIEAFHHRLQCLQTLPCDWINPGLYVPKPPEARETDILMVANWGAFKRHWEFFRALRRMSPHLKVVLIGQREPGRSRDSILALARSFGVPQRIEVHESLSIEEVARHQCNAKVSVILSRREGCCVAAVESLFAGCALAMREDAHVGPLAYINEKTGRRLRPGRIHEDLLLLLQSAKGLQPAHWAREHLANERSHSKLNTLLREAAARAGRPWSRDLAVPQWRPHPTFAKEAEREALRPVYEDLNRRFPTVFSDTLIDDSWR
jgi:glycosyltransferase involved in cell wall biosynthesis